MYFGDGVGSGLVEDCCNCVCVCFGITPVTGVGVMDGSGERHFL